MFSSHNIESFSVLLNMKNPNGHNKKKPPWFCPTMVGSTNYYLESQWGSQVKPEKLEVDKFNTVAKLSIEKSLGEGHKPGFKIYHTFSKKASDSKRIDKVLKYARFYISIFVPKKKKLTMLNNHDSIRLSLRGLATLWKAKERVKKNFTKRWTNLPPRENIVSINKKYLAKNEFFPLSVWLYSSFEIKSQQIGKISSSKKNHVFEIQKEFQEKKKIILFKLCSPLLCCSNENETTFKEVGNLKMTKENQTQQEQKNEIIKYSNNFFFGEFSSLVEKEQKKMEGKETIIKQYLKNTLSPFFNQSHASDAWSMPIFKSKNKPSLIKKNPDNLNSVEWKVNQFNTTETTKDTDSEQKQLKSFPSKSLKKLNTSFLPQSFFSYRYRNKPSFTIFAKPPNQVISEKKKKPNIRKLQALIKTLEFLDGFHTFSKKKKNFFLYLIQRKKFQAKPAVSFTHTGIKWKTPFSVPSKIKTRKDIVVENSPIRSFSSIKQVEKGILPLNLPLNPMYLQRSCFNIKNQTRTVFGDAVFLFSKKYFPGTLIGQKILDRFKGKARKFNMTKKKNRAKKWSLKDVFIKFIPIIYYKKTFSYYFLINKKKKKEKKIALIGKTFLTNVFQTFYFPTKAMIQFLFGKKTINSWYKKYNTRNYLFSQFGQGLIYTSLFFRFSGWTPVRLPTNLETNNASLAVKKKIYKRKSEAWLAPFNSSFNFLFNPHPEKIKIFNPSFSVETFSQNHFFPVPLQFLFRNPFNWIVNTPLKTFRPSNNKIIHKIHYRWIKNFEQEFSIPLLFQWKDNANQFLHLLYENYSNNGLYISSDYFKLLTQLKKHKISIIAATKNLKVLDPALMRPGRFNTIIFYYKTLNANSIHQKEMFSFRDMEYFSVLSNLKQPNGLHIKTPAWLYPTIGENLSNPLQSKYTGTSCSLATLPQGSWGCSNFLKNTRGPLFNNSRKRYVGFLHLIPVMENKVWVSQGKSEKPEVDKFNTADKIKSRYHYLLILKKRFINFFSRSSLVRKTNHKKKFGKQEISLPNLSSRFSLLISTPSFIRQKEKKNEIQLQKKYIKVSIFLNYKLFNEFFLFNLPKLQCTGSGVKSSLWFSFFNPLSKAPLKKLFSFRVTFRSLMGERKATPKELKISLPNKVFRRERERSFFRYIKNFQNNNLNTDSTTPAWFCPTKVGQEVYFKRMGKFNIIEETDKQREISNIPWLNFSSIHSKSVNFYKVAFFIQRKREKNFRPKRKDLNKKKISFGPEKRSSQFDKIIFQRTYDMFFLSNLFKNNLKRFQNKSNKSYSFWSLPSVVWNKLDYYTGKDKKKNSLSIFKFLLLDKIIRGSFSTPLGIGKSSRISRVSFGNRIFREKLFGVKKVHKTKLKTIRISTPYKHLIFAHFLLSYSFSYQNFKILLQRGFKFV